MLPDLCLLPHEAGDLAPDEPLCAPATHRLTFRKHPQHVYLVRWVEVGVGPDTEYIWMARRESIENSPLLRDERSTSDLKMLFSHLMRGKFERRLFFDSEFRLASTRDWHFSFCLGEAGGTSLTFPVSRQFYSQQAPPNNGHFRWPHLSEGEHFSRSRRTDTSDVQLEQEVAAILRDADSDGSFTFRWLQLGTRERDQLLFAATRGNIERCEQLLRWILQSDRRWETEAVWTWDIHLGSGLGSLYDAQYVAHESEIYSEKETFPLPVRLRRLLQLTLEYFPPSFKGNFIETTIFQSLWSYKYERWQIPVFAPTMHERLEAQLALRDWLRDKVSADELAELIGES